MEGSGPRAIEFKPVTGALASQVTHGYCQPLGRQALKGRQAVSGWLRVTLQAERSLVLQALRRIAAIGCDRVIGPGEAPRAALGRSQLQASGLFRPVKHCAAEVLCADQPLLPGQITRSHPVVRRHELVAFQVTWAPTAGRARWMRS